jgi:cell division protein FtsI/penicillin-binding protein 2
LSTQRATERRRRILTRAIPLVVLASTAFAVGAVVAAEPVAPAAQRLLDAWERDDYAAMHAELTPEAREEYPLKRFERIYTDAAEAATTDVITVDEVREGDDTALAPVSIATHAFGNLRGELALPIADGQVAWTPNLVYPGLAPEERLSRRTRAPQRAPILAADRTPLAEGSAAARTLDAAAVAVVGETGTPTRAQARKLASLGFPPGSLTGTSGLELAWNERLSGQPGGQLVAVSTEAESEVGGGRVLASSQPVPGEPVRTTIDPALQRAAVTALGSLFGGVAVLDTQSGDVLALSGVAYSAPQPPGSTFKVITTTGALDAGIVSLEDEFPVESSNSEIGREIANSHDAPCGGTFAQTFANSCNTVFAPLGAELGGEKLVATSELFGFNSPPALFDADATAVIEPPQSTIPEDLSSSVEVGESAIGQGQVLATPLQLATISQTIANRGVRLPTPIARTAELRPDAEPVEVTSKETAATVRDLMVGVVENGTGVAAALPGVQVAGKTGTAELGPAALAPGEALGAGEEAPQELDAWFTSFAPANDPRLAVAVMVVDAAGDGGEIAAPIAREVLAAGLGTG